MFACDVRDGLSKPGQKELPCQYFYDEVGSALFEAITVLPEYGLTRADARLVRRLAPELAGYFRRTAGMRCGAGQRQRLEDALDSGIARALRAAHVLSDRHFGHGARPLCPGDWRPSARSFRSKIRI
jgi:uncharacterized SAM-dependent methyltransferase